MELCLGTVQFGMDYGVQGGRKRSFDEIEEILRYAIDHGIDRLDTAPLYGNAEETLGRFIRGNKGAYKDIKINSKLPGSFFEIAENTSWKKYAVECARESLRRIGIDHFDSYLLHNASMLDIPEALEALYEVKKRGLAENVGVSVYNPDEAFKELLDERLTVIQIPYNVFDHRLDKAGFFELLKKNRVKVYARSSLLQGLLMMDATRLPGKVGFARSYIEKYDRMCKEYGIGRLQAAICYVGHHEGIDSVVFGVDSLDQLKEYISMHSMKIPVTLAQSLEKEFWNAEEKLVNPTLW